MHEKNKGKGKWKIKEKERREKKGLASGRGTPSLINGSSNPTLLLSHWLPPSFSLPSHFICLKDTSNFLPASCPTDCSFLFCCPPIPSLIIGSFHFLSFQLFFLTSFLLSHWLLLPFSLPPILSLSFDLFHFLSFQFVFSFSNFPPLVPMIASFLLLPFLLFLIDLFHFLTFQKKCSLLFDWLLLFLLLPFLLLHRRDANPASPLSIDLFHFFYICVFFQILFVFVIGQP